MILKYTIWVTFNPRKLLLSKNASDISIHAIFEAPFSNLIKIKILVCVEKFPDVLTQLKRTFLREFARKLHFTSHIGAQAYGSLSLKKE